MERAPVLVRHAETLHQLPPGFRFKPTDQELVVQYLRRMAFGVPLPAAVIPVVRDLYGLDPWDIPGKHTRLTTSRARVCFLYECSDVFVAHKSESNCSL
jgi:hypothetical protein